jgi:hypothetical protein
MPLKALLRGKLAANRQKTEQATSRRNPDPLRVAESRANMYPFISR